MFYTPKPKLGTPLNTKHPSSKGLVGCFVLNENTGNKIFNSNIGNSNGTKIGADWIPEGLYFDGADRVSVPEVFVGNNDAFTICARFNGAAGGIVYGEGYNGDSRWALFLGIESSPPYSARFLIKENNVWKATTVGTTTVNDGWHSICISQKNKSSRAIYIDGNLEGTNTDTVGDMSTLNTSNISVLERDTFGSYFVGGVNHVYIHDRGFANAEAKLYSREPFAVFEPPLAPALWSAFLVASTTLTVENIISAGLLDNVALTQKHTLTVQALLSAGNLDNTTLTQKHLLVLQELLSAGVLDSVALAQKNILSVQEVLSSGTLDNIVMTQKSLLAIQDLLSQGLLDSANPIQKYILAVQELLSSGTLDNIELSISALLIVADLLSSGTLDNIDLIQKHNLMIQELASSGVLDNIEIVQKHLLTVQSILSAGTLDNIELLLSTLLTVANMISVGAIDNVDPTQKHILSVDEVLSAGRLDVTAALTQKNLLAIDDLISSGVIDNIQFDIATGLICITLTQDTEYDISLTQDTEYNIMLTQTGGGIC